MPVSKEATLFSCEREHPPLSFRKVVVIGSVDSWGHGLMRNEGSGLRKVKIRGVTQLSRETVAYLQLGQA